MQAPTTTHEGITLKAPVPAGCEAMLSPQALAFVGRLTRQFRPQLTTLLELRRERQLRLDAGEELHFLDETRGVREGDWQCAAPVADLTDRRVEITGPPERKMVINALNSGASCFMADFEDSTSPTFDNIIRGQQNLFDAIRRRIDFVDPSSNKSYALAAKTATLLVRPRGLHLPEANIEVDGAPAPGCLVDFGLFFFHNARELLERGSGPYFYLPKLESHLEARLHNDIFLAAQQALEIPTGSVRATVLIETLGGAFEMEEILYELREHSAGLNCGRWDYIFSYIKTQRSRAERLLPDRSEVSMEQPLMRAYADHVVATCHRRGVHAMGGMAAQIPIKRDAAANERALAKVRADKQREASAGHDGTWVAHPGLVAIAREVFDEWMPSPNQIHKKRQDVRVSAEDLLRAPEGKRTEAGLRINARVGIQYLESWLRGQGCVPLNDLMEDAATAEISRAQIWQWLQHGASVDGTPLTRARLTNVIDEELAAIRQDLGAADFDAGRFPEARSLFEHLCTGETLAEFLTTEAYPLL